MLYSMIGAAWFIVLCWRTIEKRKRELTARQRYVIFYNRSGLVYRLVFGGQTRKEGESCRRDRGMLFSMIGAVWFIVLCLADKREKKARADGET